VRRGNNPAVRDPVVRPHLEASVVRVVLVVLDVGFPGLDLVPDAVVASADGERVCRALESLRRSSFSSSSTATTSLRAFTAPSSDIGSLV
jgi:hypothetical protein